MVEAVETHTFLVEFFYLVQQGESTLAEEWLRAHGPPNPQAEIYMAMGKWDDEQEIFPALSDQPNVCGCCIFVRNE
jgi:hypothetical protein